MRPYCLFFVLMLMGGFASPLRALSVEDLRCNYLVDPLGTDDPAPRLSWRLDAPGRGARQTARQVLVASSLEKLAHDQGDLWDAGKVASDETIQVTYAGRVLKSRDSCFWKVRVWDEKGIKSPWSQPAHWTLGLLAPADWQAQWIGVEQHLAPKPPKSKTLAPKPGDDPKLIASPEYVRKEFPVAQPIRRAVVYVTALGLYELRINGHRVGNHLLAPEWTAYAKRVQVQAFEVTDLLAKGHNAIAATLGNGWYCGLWQHWPYEVRMYGDEPLLLAQLEIELADGTRQTISSDTSWTGTADGPIVFSGIYEGETYDARKEMPGWDRAGFSALPWQTVKVVAHPPVGSLVAQRSEPIRAQRELKPVSISEPAPGVYVFDLGQNMAGWTRFRFKGKAGSTVTLQHGEMLDQKGLVFTENLHLFNKAERQLDRYTFKSDGVETFEPHFTYHGFRYVEVRGLTEMPALESLIGVVFHNDLRETGQFSCSNPLLTKLAQNIVWSQRANFMGVPTDCPQRDERCGYPGDAQFFMPTAIYNMDVAAFFSKCLVDLCEDSASPSSGAFGDHMPDFNAGGYGNVGWGDAGIICPYIFYRTYGDVQMIREHYEPMRSHLEFWIHRNGNPETKGGIRNSGGPRDWLNLKCPTKSEVIATAYFAHLCDLMAEMAQVIGKPENAAEYRTLATETREAFAQAFLSERGEILQSSQTGFALAFTMGLVPEALKKPMADQFELEIKKHGDHLATGFVGTPRLLPGLHQAGRDDLAYKLLLTETKPSWLYPVTVGATTMWERWDGYDGQNPRGGMNSLNHYAFGAVGEYLFGMIGGIQADAPGYKKIRIAPVIREGLTWARTSYDSIRGQIVSNWAMEPGTLTLDVIVPPNTTATIHLPTSDAASVTEGGRRASSIPELKMLPQENGAAVFEVAAGSYHFQAPFALR